MSFFYLKFIILFIFIILISLFSIPFITVVKPLDNQKILTIPEFNISSKNDFLWPTPGFSKINSSFGKRNAPTKGASSNHSGIDIAAPEGSKLIAVSSGQIVNTGFFGSSGYTITLVFLEYSFSYCHVNPSFIVSKNEYVKKGQVIGYVGPKYIDPIPNNQYKDSSGKQTNGASTGPHLHFTVRKYNKIINPFDIF